MTLVTKNGELKSYGTIWYHPGGIANVLSLSNVQGKLAKCSRSSKWQVCLPVVLALA